MILSRNRECMLESMERYRDEALYWPAYPDGNCMRCTRCNQSIYFFHDPHGEPYEYSTDEIITLTTAHIRQVHDE